MPGDNKLTDEWPAEAKVRRRAGNRCAFRRLNSVSIAAARALPEQVQQWRQNLYSGPAIRSCSTAGREGTVQGGQEAHPATREGANKSPIWIMFCHLEPWAGFIMSHQLTFADSEFSSKHRQTRKRFSCPAWKILPWQNMVEVIEPFYPKAGNGRRPYPLETMLRIQCNWYNRATVPWKMPCTPSIRLFARLSLDSAPSHHHHEFPPPARQHQLARQLFRPSIAGWPSRRHDDLKALWWMPPPSVRRNKEQQRDPEMHQTKKGNQWHFGMKAPHWCRPRGPDPQPASTAANEHDLNWLGNLPWREQFARAGYQRAPSARSWPRGWPG